ncbi:MAG: hypothetical protein JOZ33_16265 [Acidobacteriaceae bacterium]|nr:hypothetical protein [Acidobacteriaceae bacterium]
MRRGVWHQCGDRSQKLVQEQLGQGAGVGVILSPRDLSRENAITYSESYQKAGADVLIDYQFYVPDFTNALLGSYPISSFRRSVSALNKISDQDLITFQNELRADHSALKASAVIAPAVVYEAGRTDILQLNSRLFASAKEVSSDLSIPIYASVVLGRSVTSSDQTMQSVLSQATAMSCDGWYFGFEFEDERIPSSREMVRRCCVAGLTLACTGKPVLHAYAGPMGLLSFGFGATGIAIGHSQNLWKFTRDRWAPPSGQGGGGDAPARYFSRALWGTIVYPDETSQIPAALRNQIVSQSPFCAPVSANLQWNRWDAGKHLVYILAQQYSSMAMEADPRKNANAAIDLLGNALTLHMAIQQNNVFLADDTNAYQGNWKLALEDLLKDGKADFDFLELMP